MKTKLLVMGVLIIALSLIFLKDIGKLFASDNDRVMDEAQNMEQASASIAIIKQWDLPGELKEVSGIAYIDAQRFACVQDEDGVIFIYNIASNAIEKKIPFAGSGDYEGITLAGSTAWVVRSDGQLYEVKNYNSANAVVSTHETPFNAGHNIEGLTYDKKQNRLLLAVKDEDLAGKDQKGVYAFDIATKKLQTQPVYTIAVKNALLSTGKKNKEVRPSAIGIHPVSGDPYVVDGPRSRLLRLDQSGKLVDVMELGKKFEKPEGITFDHAGKMYISNERGKKTPANIMLVEAR